STGSSRTTTTWGRWRTGDTSSRMESIPRLSSPASTSRSRSRRFDFSPTAISDASIPIRSDSISTLPRSVPSYRGSSAMRWSAAGIIGEDTARALAVPLDVRAKQIALALERLRWLPALPPDRAFVVNVPAFELSVFEDYGSGRPPVMEMSVVVGRADLTQTPFFVATLTTITFAPY